MSRGSKAAASAVAAGLSSLVIVAAAQASSQRVTGGHATVTTSSAISHFIAFLRSQGITVTAIAPATFANGSLTTPIVNGHMTVPGLHGVMDTSGGLRFKKGNRILRVRDYHVSHQGDGAALSALVASTRVSPRRLVLARMAAMSTHVSGKTGTMSGGLAITAAWAQLIDGLIGKHLLKAGDDLGDLSATVKMA